MGADLDWGNAEVHDGELTVPLTEEAPKQWARRVQSVVDRLGQPGSGWSDVKATRKKVTVRGVTPGAEGDLRHLLESAVLQANADLEDPDADGDDASEADRAMTDTFRAFGEQDVAAQGQD